MTHIRDGILVVLCRLNRIRLIVAQQQSAAIEGCRKTWDDDIGLTIATGREWSGRASKDVLRAGLREGTAIIGKDDSIVANLAIDVSEGGLRVDGER